MLNAHFLLVSLTSLELLFCVTNLEIMLCSGSVYLPSEAKALLKLFFH